MTVAEIAPIGVPGLGGGAAAETAAASWGRSSRRLAAAGDVRGAVRSQLAADLATLHCLLWESGLADVPDPSAQLGAVAGVVGGALDRAGQAPASAAAQVAWARTALTTAFGAPVDALLSARFSALDHLEPLGAVPTGSARTARGVDALVRDLGEVARDCAVVARAMAVAGLPADADDQLRRATLATFEAFLLERAASAGEDLPAAELRWELAMERLRERPGASRDPLTADTLTDELVAELMMTAGQAVGEELRRRIEALR